MKPNKPHQSQRGHFAFHFYDEMQKNKNIWLLTGGLGFKMWDFCRDDFPDRVIECGASEQAMLDIAVGLAYEGKIPVCYSITPFLIYRPFETIRTYINYEKLNVKLVGSGRGLDYDIDGWSHHSPDVNEVLKAMRNIKEHYPVSIQDITQTFVSNFINEKTPSFLSLRR